MGEGLWATDYGRRTMGELRSRSYVKPKYLSIYRSPDTLEYIFGKPSACHIL